MIYKNAETNVYYKMLKPVGTLTIKGYQHYALWRPVKKFLIFWISCGEDFWLDIAGFEEIS